MIHLKTSHLPERKDFIKLLEALLTLKQGPVLIEMGENRIEIVGKCIYHQGVEYTKVEPVLEKLYPEKSDLICIPDPTAPKGYRVEKWIKG